jgi:hypothetical protein
MTLPVHSLISEERCLMVLLPIATEHGSARLKQASPDSPLFGWTRRCADLSLFSSGGPYEPLRAYCIIFSDKNSMNSCSANKMGRMENEVPTVRRQIKWQF